MKSLYGQPDATNFDTPTQATYTYGNSFVITSNPSDVSTIFTVLSSGHNGLNTPAGVGVGMDEAVITEKYGPCEREKSMVSPTIITLWNPIRRCPMPLGDIVLV